MIFYLGDTVKDAISGFQGLVTAKVFYLYGCIRCRVAGKEKRSGNPKELILDQAQLKLVKRAKNKEDYVKNEFELGDEVSVKLVKFKGIISSVAFIENSTVPRYLVEGVDNEGDPSEHNFDGTHLKLKKEGKVKPFLSVEEQIIEEKFRADLKKPKVKKSPAGPRDKNKLF